MKASFQFVIELDVTGSMRPVHRQMIRHNSDLIRTAFRTIPALEMGFVAIGDDRPKEGPYMTKVLPLTNDWNRVEKFLHNLEPACGGDFEECYELGLNDAGNFAWEPSAKKVMLFCGDAEPHPIRDAKNPRGLDWRKEARSLVERGVEIHTLHCLAHYGAGHFWRELAKIGNGMYFQLDQASHFDNILVGMCHRFSGGVSSLEQFERELQETSSSVPVGVRKSFDTMAGRTSTTYGRADKRTPIPDASRFQVLTCDAEERQDVKEFAVAQGLIASEAQFNRIIKGQLYYAHTERTETLRPDHQVVIQDIRSDEMFTGSDAREWLGCPFGSSMNLKANPLGSNYTVWIQSKSVNRKMFPDQKVLVEMNDKIKLAMAEVAVPA